MKTKFLLIVGLGLSIVGNVYLFTKLNQIHIQPRAGKDVSVEMKNMFDGSWEEICLVHGYIDNFPAAAEIVNYAEETSGRPKGSFRVKRH